MPDNKPRTITRRTFLISAIPTAALISAGCTPSYINTEVLGTPATGAEIKAHLSGKSVRYASTAGGPVDVENYYGANGVFKAVTLDEDAFVLGTWRIHNSLGKDFLLQQYDVFFIENGHVSRGSSTASFVYYIQPDGTAILDQMGGGNFEQPRPRRGFPAEARWNALKRKAGV